jgi:hypothetical protein
MVSHHLCHVFGIDMAADDLVLFIGNDEATNNGDAIRDWIAGQDGLQNNSRREMAIELRDRLRDVLFDIESAIRAVS